MSFKTIGTHNGTFHCDEVLGCSMLRLLNKDAEIVRSRDPSILDKCDIVIDVGNIYNPETLRFDHHQKDFNQTMNSINEDMPYHIKLSSSGLIYSHFGEDIIMKIAGNEIDKQALPHIYKKVYESFIEEIDAIDNGISMFDGEPKYTIDTNLSKRVGHLNKVWNHKGDYDEEAAFQQAMKLAGGELVETVKYVCNSWWPARNEIMNAISTRYQVYKSGEIILLEQYVPFLQHLLFLEKEMKIEPIIKFVIFKEGNQWIVRTVNKTISSYEQRVPLLEIWQGLREQELVEKGAKEGAVFVHVDGFIGVHRTLEGVRHMASQEPRRSKGIQRILKTLL